ncbi:MAG TPA: peptidase, partial [Burkholderiales bacterium]|nr:peptidase [Burkholderiales bacterium]
MTADTARHGIAVNFARIVLAAGLALATTVVSAAATIILVNINAPGEGFNDPTPVVPVGGNAGTTLGQQRIIVFAQAASIWGTTLTSAISITIRASFVPLTCDATTGVLGRAGALNLWRDFPGAPRANTFYGQALANKLAGANLGANVKVEPEDIIARFNSALGQPDCLPNTTFYLGLDNNHGAQVDLLNTMLHEFAHGLGFQSFTNPETGAQFDNARPTIWDHFTLDTTTNKTWANMTDAERVASAINARKLVWNGANVTSSAPQVLSSGTPNLVISGPAAGAAAGTYDIGTADFGPQLGTPAVTGQLMPVVDSPNQVGLACNPLSAANILAV